MKRPIIAVQHVTITARITATVKSFFPFTREIQEFLEHEHPECTQLF